MASAAAEQEEPLRPPDEPSHSEPAFREAQKWIEEVTGKSFGEKDFRSGLENGILLCELLCSIRPGLVKKINRLPTPIAGLDNLSVFLRGCKEMGLTGSQLFDPGDLQATSADSRDSGCSRKLKNVLVTVFWLGKAVSVCPSYNGPVLNLKEFEELLSHMRTEDKLGSGVRDSGYDCWDSESLSPPQHTRDDSLDSLDSYGSQSQTSPSLEGITHGDSESEAANRKPDVHRDDMLARRTAVGESRSSVPFNQFLPNRSNATAYVPTSRRRPRPEDVEQCSVPLPIQEERKGSKEGGGTFKKPLGPRSRNPKTVTWAPEGGGLKEEEEGLRQEEVLKQEEEEQQRLKRLQKAGIKVLPAVIRYGRPTPPFEQQEVRSPSPDIILRCHNDFLTNQKATWDSDSEGEAESGGVRTVPDIRRDDLASRRNPRPHAAPRTHQYIPAPACSQRDRQVWENIRQASHRALMERMEVERRTSEAECDIIIRRNNPFLNPSSQQDEEEEEEGTGRGVKVRLPNKTKDDLARRKAQSRQLPSHRDGPMSFVPASITRSDLDRWERLKMAEPSESSPSPVCRACLKKPGTPDILTPATGSFRCHSKFVTFGGVTELNEQPIKSPKQGESELLRKLQFKTTITMPIMGLRSQLPVQTDSHMGGVNVSQNQPLKYDPPTVTPPLLESERGEREEEEDDGKVLDLQRDNMNPILPLPGSKRPVQEVVTDRKRQQPWCFAETPQQHTDMATVVRSPVPRNDSYDDDGDDEEESTVPDLEKDDMLARRTREYQRSMGGHSHSFNLFLPVPGAAQHLRGGAKPLSKQRQQPDSSCVSPAAGPVAMPSKTTTRKCLLVREDNLSLSPTPPPSSNPPTTPPPLDQISEGRGDEGGKEREKEKEMEGGIEEGIEGGIERELGNKEESRKVGGESHRRPFWLEDDDLPTMMLSRRVCSTSEESESMSMIDMPYELEGAGLMEHLGQSRYKRMQDQYTYCQEEEEEWRNDLARWKSRRRGVSQDLIRKEEERKMMERRMKEEEGHAQKKNIKTYREIVEEKERREAELCAAYKRAGSKEEAAMVLQRYALRFTISDATLESLQLPRTTSTQNHIKQNPVSKTTGTDQNLVPGGTRTDGESSKTKTDQESRPTDTQQDHNQYTKATPLTQQNHTEPVTQHKPQNHTEPQTQHTVPPPISPPPRPLPLLTAKPYSRLSLQPVKIPQTGHQLFKDPQIRHQPVKNPQTGQQPLRDPQTRHQPVKNPQTGHQPVKDPQTGHQPIMDSQTGHQFHKDPQTGHQPVMDPHTGHQPVKDPQTGHQPVKDPQTGHQPVKDPQTGHQPVKDPQTGHQPVKDPQTGHQPVKDPQTGLQPVKDPQTGHQPVKVNSSVGLSRRSGEELGSDSTWLSNQNTYSSSVTEGHQGSNVTIESPMLNLAKRVNHWVWNPEEERSRQEKWQQEQERLLQEEYLREQEKLKVEWERAQTEVEEEERRHNEEERKILEETATHLFQAPPIQISIQIEPIAPAPQIYKTEPIAPAPQIYKTEPIAPAPQIYKTEPIAPALQIYKTEPIAPAPQIYKSEASAYENSQDQHAMTPVPFTPDASWESESSMGQMTSLDCTSQQDLPSSEKRSGSYDCPHSPLSSSISSSSPQPFLPSRCVSGKRLCSGCGQLLEKGAAMSIDTLGLYYHLACFKCGVCKGQLGDSSSGTDVRIRNGLLSCRDCYLASHVG